MTQEEINEIAKASYNYKIMFDGIIALVVIRLVSFVSFVAWLLGKFKK